MNFDDIDIDVAKAEEEIIKRVREKLEGLFGDKIQIGTIKLIPPEIDSEEGGGILVVRLNIEEETK